MIQMVITHEWNGSEGNTSLSWYCGPSKLSITVHRKTPGWRTALTDSQTISHNSRVYERIITPFNNKQAYWNLRTSVNQREHSALCIHHPVTFCTVRQLACIKTDSHSSWLKARIKRCKTDVRNRMTYLLGGWKTFGNYFKDILIQCDRQT